MFAWIRLIEIAHDEGDAPGIEHAGDPLISVFTPSLWYLAQYLRRIADGEDARVIFGQAPGRRGNIAPDIAMSVAESYYRHHEPGRKGPGVKTTKITCDMVRAELGRTEAQLSDKTILTYKKRHRAYALSSISHQALMAQIPPSAWVLSDLHSLEHQAPKYRDTKQGRVIGSPPQPRGFK